ncbi:MAG: ABC transporter permease, partial [Bacteroidota bacterium]
MLFNNLKYATRSLWRDKFYSGLNGLGLAVGIAISLLIFLWVNDELSFDRFHQEADRTYRVLTEWSFGGNREMIATTPIPLSVAAREQLTEVEDITWTGELWDEVIQYSDQSFTVADGLIADSRFFELFDFDFLHGSKATALATPNSMVLSSAMAQRIFGQTDVIGQPLRLVDRAEYIVSAVLDDLPGNSSIQMSCVIPYVEGSQTFKNYIQADQWGQMSYHTYVRLRPNIAPAAMKEKLTALHPTPNDDYGMSYQLQPLTDIHLDRSGLLSGSASGYNKMSVIRIMSIIGILILLIACINYVNLTTARSVHRARAAGVRKIIGAGRWQLFTQHFAEAAILVLLAALVGAALANLSLGIFETLSGKAFTTAQLFTPTTLLILLGTVVVTLLLSGIHPAIQLSKFKPLEAIRGTKFSVRSGQNYLRRGLVTGQFVCSGALIICTLVMLQQLRYVQEKNLGYEREHIFNFFCSEASPLLMKQQLAGQPGVVEVTASDNSIVNLNSRYGGFDYEGKPEEADPYLVPLMVDEQFPEFFGLQLNEGRWFRPGNADTTSFILNEAAVAELGFEEPLGKWMNFSGQKGTVVGVVKDFHFRSLHEKIQQLVLYQSPHRMWRVYVKTTGAQAATAIASAKAVFEKLEPGSVFHYEFLEEAYDELYKTEVRSIQLLTVFSLIAVLISCLGILGLAAYAAERRQKEIGIRKVLGASFAQLVSLLSREFLGLVLLAIIVAAPISWYFMEDWLSGFAYRIDMPVGVYLLAGGIALLIAFLTVSLQSFKAVLRNPV